MFCVCVCVCVCVRAHVCACMCVDAHTYIYIIVRARDLQYISISQYIDTLVEYRIVIRCSMNIEISDSAEQCMFHAVNITFLCV